ncbi:hypothetical protein PHMEG_000191 [Phytophthora megakarya]|uniref:Uncharacterized protein n=1 Tax=Phytophthora megakarya TaxID=4795 RepID=A0A225X5X7_9STRA|nr:hypothetical protein PHMEG_000191 [Phytophthora megakarya]
MRNFNQQQMPDRYFQSGVDPSSYAKPGRHRGSLVVGEFGDILDPSTEGATAAPDMSMASFDVAFHEGMADPGAFQTHSKPPAKSSATATDAALVDAAYTQLHDPATEPDLTTQKLTKDKPEKCQFHDCPNRARVAQTYGKFCNRHVIVSPCGFPGCRDKAMERTAMCVKHMELGKEALQEILKARSPNVPVCKMSGCFKNDQGRGYCRGHEKLLMATGRLPPHINKRRLNSAYTMCSYPDCNKHSQRNHLCRTHGNLIIKQAQELAERPGATETYEDILARMQTDVRRCTHENCTKNSQRDRLCTTHYYEKHRLHKDNSSSASDVVGSKEKVGSRMEAGRRSDVRAVERTRCGKPGCGNLSYSGGLCVQHVKENQNMGQNQGHYGDPFSSGESSRLFSGDVDSEAKPGLLQKSQAMDNLKLESQTQQQQHEMELAEAAATAAAASEAKQASLYASGKARKYYCKIEGCDKQAQKRNLCKRHYRLQEGGPAGKSHPSIGRSAPSSNIGVPQIGFSLSTTGCQFPSCSQTACDGSLLCLTHSKATFCWQPGCENLVGHQQFCEFHAFRQQCAYEGCTYTADRNNSGCMNHVMAQKCRHDFCDKFAVGSDNEWCRLHQINCQDAPCALCKLHALPPDGCAPSENENSSRRHPRGNSRPQAMERIYSAFFTTERRREPPELTAEVLELHNETQKTRKQPPLLPPGRDRRRPDKDEESTQEAKRHAAARRRDLRQLAMDWTSVKKDLEAACQAAARAFLLAYGAKAFTAVLLASRKWSSLEYGYADAARLLLKGDTLRFGAFFGSLVGIFRVSELATRAARGGQRDAVNLAIAGAVSGSALLLDSPSRRNTISLYIFVRMLDVGYYQWICRIGAVNHHGLEFTIRQRMRDQLDAHGNPLPFRLCQPHYHMYVHLLFN